MELTTCLSSRAVALAQTLETHCNDVFHDGGSLKEDSSMHARKWSQAARRTSTEASSAGLHSLIEPFASPPKLPYGPALAAPPGFELLPPKGCFGELETDDYHDLDLGDFRPCSKPLPEVPEFQFNAN
jgi:hypothetical protein